MSIVPLHVLDEHRIDLGEAGKLLGTEQRPASLAKMCRSINPGIKAETGERIRLEAVRTGGYWITSVEAVRRFVDRLTRAASGETETNEPTPAPRRARELAAVDAELAKAGL